VNNASNIVACLALAAGLNFGCSAQGPESPEDYGAVAQPLEFTSAIVYDPGTVQYVYDPSTATWMGLHTCPSGSVMIGAHIGNNVWKCAQVPAGSLGTPRIDRYTIRNGMHSCPIGQVMVGLHVGNNALACSTTNPAITVAHELTDGNPPTNDSYPMHVCKPNPFFANHSTAMTGVHIGNNVWTCGF
jgi:hypothetical protein